MGLSFSEWVFRIAGDCGRAGGVRCVSGCLMTLVLCSQAAAAADPAETFKRILSAPPIVSEMLFQEKLPPTPNRPTPLDVGLTYSTNYAAYRLVWQPNAMFFQSLPPTNGGSPSRAVPSECFAVWDNEFYFLDPGQFAFVYHLPDESLVRGSMSAPQHAAVYKQHHACEALNLGLNHLKPGSVRWNGDAFSAWGSADQKPMFVSGRITGWTNQVPNEMQVQYSNDMGVANYRLVYSYQPDQPLFFPSTITSYLQRQGREIEYRAYQIVSVTTTNVPLGREAIDPERYMEMHGMRVRWMTNGTLYAQLPGGSLIETPGAVPKVKLTPEDYYANRYYYLAVILSTLGLIALLVRTNQTSKQLSTPS